MSFLGFKTYWCTGYFLGRHLSLFVTQVQSHGNSGYWRTQHLVLQIISNSVYQEHYFPFPSLTLHIHTLIILLHHSSGAACNLLHSSSYTLQVMALYYTQSQLWYVHSLTEVRQGTLQESQRHFPRVGLHDALLQNISYYFMSLRTSLLCSTGHTRQNTSQHFAITHTHVTTLAEITAQYSQSLQTTSGGVCPLEG